MIKLHNPRNHPNLPSVFGTLLSILLVYGVVADVQPTQRGDGHISVSINDPDTKVTKTCQTPNEDGTCPAPSNLEECGIWLAPSSIPGAGLGMYAGRDFKTGENLQPTGDIVIPQVDLDRHCLNNAPYILWDDYTWGAVSDYNNVAISKYTPSPTIVSPRKLNMLALWTGRIANGQPWIRIG
jgi:hypothetical protein